eukprot:2394572-Ditylum_brightwellii.AAC.1
MPQLEIAEDTAPEPLIVNPSGKYNEDLFDTIITAYYKYKEVPIDERLKILKLKWSSKSKKLTVAAGKKAEQISNQYDVVNLEDLNTLYYATLYTVSPPKARSDGQKRATPDISYEDKLLKSIVYLHKKLGKYVAIHQKDDLTDRNKEFLAGKDCEEM